MRIHSEGYGRRVLEVTTLSLRLPLGTIGQYHPTCQSRLLTCYRLHAIYQRPIPPIEVRSMLKELTDLLTYLHL